MSATGLQGPACTQPKGAAHTSCASSPGLPIWADRCVLKSKAPSPTGAPAPWSGAAPSSSRRAWLLNTNRVQGLPSLCDSSYATTDRKVLEPMLQTNVSSIRRSIITSSQRSERSKMRHRMCIASVCSASCVILTKQSGPQQQFKACLVHDKLCVPLQMFC